MQHIMTVTKFVVFDGSTSVNYNTTEHDGINFTKIGRYSGHPRNLLRFPASVKDFFRLTTTSIPALGPQPAPSSVTTGVSVTGDKAPGKVKLTNHHQLLPKPRMNGATSPFPTYAFMARIRTTLLYLCNVQRCYAV